MVIISYGQAQFTKILLSCNTKGQSSNRVVVTLNDLQKQSWSVLHDLCEQLEQVTFVIEVDENSQFLKLCLEQNYTLFNKFYIYFCCALHAIIIIV